MKAIVLSVFLVFVYSLADCKQLTISIPDDEYQTTILSFCESQGWDSILDVPASIESIPNPESCEDFVYRKMIDFIRSSIAKKRAAELTEEYYKTVESQAVNEVNIEKVKN